MLSFQTVHDPELGEVLEVPLAGHELLECPVFNKGSAFPEEERRALGLVGLLPPHVSSLEEQLARRYQEYRHKANDLERYIFLRALQDRNETLFYRLVLEHIEEMLPIIYTPCVGAACQHYSTIYRRPRGLFISVGQQDEIDTILANRFYRDVDVIVVTDGERILGLGDQGVGGMGIPIGKLSLYTLCAGIHPARTLPIMLDVGTNNPDLTMDPLYLGRRHPRVRGPKYDDFIEAFVQAVERHLPHVLLQWEDFGRANAHRLLERYRSRLCSFNDDIQGTAAVTLAGLLTALRETGGRLGEQQIVILGAGSAGTGISDLLTSALMREGLTVAEARARLWLVDRRGLLESGADNLEPFQRRHCQPAERVTTWQRDASGGIHLLEVIRQVQPSILIGVSAQAGAFTEEIVRTMARAVARPIIFPLSNPTARSEASPADLVGWTDGRALIAAGSPFADVLYNGRTIPVSQCNNAFIFPGIGLGVIASGAREITEEMFLAAAGALHECALADAGQGRLFPPFTAIRAVSRSVALAVAQAAQHQGLAEEFSHEQWERRLASMSWQPGYLAVRHGSASDSAARRSVSYASSQVASSQVLV